MFGLLMIALFTLLPMTGCSSPQTGVKYSMGKMSAYLDALPPQIIQASREAPADPIASGH
jgi:hypothetical protein